MSRDVYSSLRWLTVSKAIAQILAWVSTILVLRLLTPADYGLVTMATIFSSYLLFLGDFGVGPGLINRRERDRRTLEAAQGLSVVGSLALFALIVGTAPFVAAYFNDHTITRLVQVGALMFVAVGLTTVPRAMLSIDMRFKEISIAGLISSLATTTMTVGLAYAGLGAWALVLGTITGAFCLALAMIAFAGAVPPRLDISPLRGLLGFSAYTLAERSVWYWYTQMDSLIVGRVLGQSVLGVLSVGKDLAAAPVSKVVEVTNQVAFPYFAKLQEAPDEIVASYRKATRISMSLAFPALWGLAVTANDLIEILLGSAWRGATTVVATLAVVMPFRFSSSLSTALLYGIGRADQAFRNMAATVVVSAILLTVGVRWGLAGVCAAWMIVIPFAFLLALRAICKRLPVAFNRLVSDIARCSVPALLMVVACVVAKLTLDDATPMVRLSATIATGVIVWILAAVGTSRSLLAEIRDSAREFVGS